MSKLPNVHFGSPTAEPLEWRVAKTDPRDDDQLRPMEPSARRLLKADPIALFSVHEDPEGMVDPHHVEHKSEEAGERDDSKFYYVPLLRPAHFSTLPRDVKWDYVELPHDFQGNRPDLKRGKNRHGVIRVDRRLTPDECYRFDLKERA